MFKPEYILDNVATFGYWETVEIVKKKFQRMGKDARIALIMANELVANTTWIPEITNSQI